MSETPIVISLEIKNRKVYGLDENGKPTENTPCEVVEALVLGPAPSFEIQPIPTFNTVGKTVERILNGLGPDGKPKKYKTVIIDGISRLSRWAEQVIIAELNKKWPGTTAIGKENLAAWSARNNLTCLPLERLATWSELNGANVFFTTLMTGDYIDGVMKGYKIDCQPRIIEIACDTRICFMKDGRGYIARFEKIPPHVVWEGKDEIALPRGTLFMEMAKRGML